MALVRNITASRVSARFMSTAGKMPRHVRARVTQLTRRASLSRTASGHCATRLNAARSSHRARSRQLRGRSLTRFASCRTRGPTISAGPIPSAPTRPRTSSPSKAASSRPTARTRWRRSCTPRCWSARPRAATRGRTAPSTRCRPR
eukprot:7388083-Prymnesium_polylepis.1